MRHGGALSPLYTELGSYYIYGYKRDLYSNRKSNDAIISHCSIKEQIPSDRSQPFGCLVTNRVQQLEWLTELYIVLLMVLFVPSSLPHSSRQHTLSLTPFREMLFANILRTGENVNWVGNLVGGGGKQSDKRKEDSTIHAAFDAFLFDLYTCSILSHREVLSMHFYFTLHINCEWIEANKQLHVGPTDWAEWAEWADWAKWVSDGQTIRLNQLKDVYMFLSRTFVKTFDL